jgi:NADPH-dependent glutamate synthase beta subunit-like oxidoreductase
MVGLKKPVRVSIMKHRLIFVVLWQVEWVKDAAGRWKIEEVPDSEKIYPCQLVLLAMGFLGPEVEVIESLKLEQVSITYPS